VPTTTQAGATLCCARWTPWVSGSTRSQHHQFSATRNRLFANRFDGTASNHPRTSSASVSSGRSILERDAHHG
jgi:hypothetical protein